MQALAQERNKHVACGWKYSRGAAASSPGSSSDPLSMQVEQAKNDLDVDQDADLAYNSLKVRRLVGKFLELPAFPPWRMDDGVCSQVELSTHDTPLVSSSLG